MKRRQVASLVQTFGYAKKQFVFESDWRFVIFNYEFSKRNRVESQDQQQCVPTEPCDAIMVSLCSLRYIAIIIKILHHLPKYCKCQSKNQVGIVRPGAARAGARAAGGSSRVIILGGHCFDFSAEYKIVHDMVTRFGELTVYVRLQKAESEVKRHRCFQT